jgi:hypothetical protein
MEMTNRIASLQERVDRKYVIRRDLFHGVANQLTDGYYVMELEGKRHLRYDTVYFDTHELLCYRSHLQGRRLRFKVRSRRYRDSRTCVFELKYKNARGRTFKERIDYPWQRHGTIDREATGFVAASLLRHYKMDFKSQLYRALDVSFSRVTLVNPTAEHRITCDFDVTFRTVEGGEAQLGSEYLILETKGDFAPSSADLLLRRLGQRPVNCSKYCVGLASSDHRVKTNPFRRILRSYFALPDGAWATAEA